MIVVIQSLQDFIYMAIMGFLRIYCLDPESDHIASESFETFHTPPNYWVLMKSLSLAHCWFTAEMFLQLTCGFKIK